MVGYEPTTNLKRLVILGSSYHTDVCSSVHLYYRNWLPFHASDADANN